MSLLARRSLVFALLILPIGLGGCEDKDEQQRKAFVEFLRTRILDKPGAHLPQLGEAEIERFGEYARQYAIIGDFHRNMDNSVNGQMRAAVSRGVVKSVGELVTRRDDIQQARETLNQMSASLSTDLAAADTARAKLNQPADLKPIYDKVYHRLVTSLAKSFNEMMPVADSSLVAALNVSDYLVQHKNQITISGESVQVKDSKTQSELNGLLADMNSHAQSIIEAQRKFRSAAFGDAN